MPADFSSPSFYFFCLVSFTRLHSWHFFWHRHPLSWYHVKIPPLHNGAFHKAPEHLPSLRKNKQHIHWKDLGRSSLPLLPGLGCCPHPPEMLILRILNRENASRWCPRIASGFGNASETCATPRAPLTSVGTCTVEGGAGGLRWHLHSQHLHLAAAAFLQPSGWFSQISTFSGYCSWSSSLSRFLLWRR